MCFFNGIFRDVYVMSQLVLVWLSLGSIFLPLRSCGPKLIPKLSLSPPADRLLALATFMKILAPDFPIDFLVNYVHPLFLRLLL